MDDRIGKGARRTISIVIVIFHSVSIEECKKNDESILFGREVELLKLRGESSSKDFSSS